MSRMRPARRSASAPPSQLPAELRRAAARIEREQWDEAQTLLQDLCHRYPQSQEAHLMLLEVAQATENGPLIESTIDQLGQLEPDDPNIQLAAAQTALLGGRQALARKRLQAFLDRWPTHPEAAIWRSRSCSTWRR